jgi:hypothetical protein
MKVKAEDILKPGAVLEVRKIDFNDPEVRAFVEYAKREQRKILRYKIVTRKTLDAVITI